MPLGDIQGAVRGLPVTHAVILAPGNVKSQRFPGKKQEVDLFLKPLKLTPGLGWKACGPWEESCSLIWYLGVILQYFGMKIE